MNHVLFANAANVFYSAQGLGQTKPLLDSRSKPSLRHKSQRAFGNRPAKGAKHRPVVHRLRCRNRCVRVAHRGHRDEAALQNDRRLDAEKRRLPDHQVGPFSHFNRPDFMRNAVRDRRVDGVFAYVAFGAKVVMAFCVAG